MHFCKDYTMTKTVIEMLEESGYTLIDDYNPLHQQEPWIRVRTVHMVLQDVKPEK